MEILTTVLMAAWIWMFIRGYITRFLTDWLIHLTVIPLIAYGCWHTPTETRNILAVAGGLMLLQLLTNRDLSVPKTAVKPQRRSSIPPPP